MPPKKAYRRANHITAGKNIDVAANTCRANGSLALGRSIIVIAAAPVAHTAFSFANSAAKRNMRQRKSRRAITARKAHPTSNVAIGSIAYASPNSQDSRTGGDRTTRPTASTDGPTRSPNVVLAILKVTAAKPATAKQLMIWYDPQFLPNAKCAR